MNHALTKPRPARSAALAERGSAYSKLLAITGDEPEDARAAPDHHAVGDRASTSGLRSFSFDCSEGIPAASLRKRPFDNGRISR
jgi:hypothetical protein